MCYSQSVLFISFQHSHSQVNRSAAQSGRQLGIGRFPPDNLSTSPKQPPPAVLVAKSSVALTRLAADLDSTNIMAALSTWRVSILGCWSLVLVYSRVPSPAGIHRQGTSPPYHIAHKNPALPAYQNASFTNVHRRTSLSICAAPPSTCIRTRAFHSLVARHNFRGNKERNGEIQFAFVLPQSHSFIHSTPRFPFPLLITLLVSSHYRRSRLAARQYPENTPDHLFLFMFDHSPISAGSNLFHSSHGSFDDPIMKKRTLHRPVAVASCPRVIQAYLKLFKHGRSATNHLPAKHAYQQPNMQSNILTISASATAAA